MQPTSHLEQKIRELESFLKSISLLESFQEKLEFLNTIPNIINEIEKLPPLLKFIKNLTPESEYAIKSIFALGQGAIVFNRLNAIENIFQRLLDLLEQLLEIEIFYSRQGGIIGYHLMVLKLIVSQQKGAVPPDKESHYIHPEGLFLGSEEQEVKHAVRWGIENIERIAMIYPLGGAGERLNLKDELTGSALPVALLHFLGHTLLEGLLRELQGREYLFFKLTGRQHLTPIAIMTSVEKNNHIHILNICKKSHWFGRPSESFYFFLQPVVPVITIEGNWSLLAPLTLTLKPNGHGVLWKLAEEQGVLHWLESQGCDQCLIRQINNPVAGTDNSLLALLGIGCHDQKAFGFVSCERLLNSDEGTDVLIESKKEGKYEYCLTNIEYTDFNQRGIGEHPLKPGSPFSIYPTNTNLLFAHLPSIRKSLKICEIPGQLINMKSKVPYIDPQGKASSILGGRLESTMQNIADYLVDSFPKPLKKDEFRHSLKTFIVYNKRSKVISTTKRSYVPGESPHGTPEQTYYDLLTNHHELLLQCSFKLPSWIDFEGYLKNGPSCILLFHPALGPLFSIISQKIRGGEMSQDAELQLEIAEVDLEGLSLKGSLLIEAVSPLGAINDKKILQYGVESRCSLKKVTIRNKGISKEVTQHYWKNELIRKESVTITLHEGAEFHAEEIVLEGSHRFEVPAHHRLVLQALPNGKWKEVLTEIEAPTWYWSYYFDENNDIRLEKIFHNEDLTRN